MVEVELVMDSESLQEHPSDEKHLQFLLFWLNKHETKAVVTKRAWNTFTKGWEKKLPKNSETANAFFATMRGLFTPYRDKYASEAGLAVENDENAEEEKTEEGELSDIVNRHYPTVKYLIVKNPETFQATGLKIAGDKILNSKQFYNKLEIDDTVLIAEFCAAYESQF